MEQNTALLIMDMQQGILNGFPGSAALVSKAAEAIAAARQNNIPVIYVVVGFRAGFPEISSNNMSFSAAKQHFAAVDMAEFMNIHPDLAPADGELIVIKRRISAFTGSDLEVILRAKNIQHLVLSGIATSGVVLSTLREAADKDYRLTVIEDCCADREEEVHRLLMDKIFVRHGIIMSVAAWAESLTGKTL